jgi:hypothetical protein
MLATLHFSEEAGRKPPAADAGEVEVSGARR